MFYSEKTGGFYDAAIHQQRPEDCVEISAAEHALLLDALAAGKSIRLVDGKPQAADQAAPMAEESLAALRQRRDRLLEASDFTQIADAPLSDAERFAWAEYRQALRDLPDSADPAHLIWPQEPHA